MHHSEKTSASCSNARIEGNLKVFMLRRRFGLEHMDILHIYFMIYKSGYHIIYEYNHI